MILREYEKIDGNEIEKDIKSEFDGSLEEG